MNAFSGGGSLSIRHKARPSVLHTIRVTYLTYFVLYVTGHGSTAEDEGQILSAAEVGFGCMTRVCLPFCLKYNYEVPSYFVHLTQFLLRSTISRWIQVRLHCDDHTVTFQAVDSERRTFTGNQLALSEVTTWYLTSVSGDSN